MSGIFGGGATINNSQTPLTAFNVQSSVYGAPIAIVYGRTRISPNLIGYYDFSAVAHTESSSSGGKGGGGVTTNSTSYTYKVSVLLGLCEGPVASVNAMWVDKAYTSNANAFTKFLGGYSQNAWPYMTSKHSSEALAYRGLAYVAASNYDLGDSASLGNHSFDVTGRLAYSAGTIDGANPKDIIQDFITNANYGAAPQLGAYLGDWSQFSSYCVASGLFLSPAYNQQQEARQTIAELINITNSAAFFSEGKIKIVPFGDTAITGNGVTYTPVVSPVYALGDDDFLDIDQPVRVLRTPNADAYNQVTVEFLDGANQYNKAVATATDQASIETYGLRAYNQVTAHSITDAATARLVAQLILQRVLFTRNVYEFKLGWKYCRLEPCDYVTITDSRLGLNAVPVRILSVEEDADGQLAIQAEDAPAGVLHSPLYDSQGGGGATVNYGVSPGSVVAPAFFESPPTQAITGLRIGIAVTGNSDDWGGCEVWGSNDGSSYAFLGRLVGGARYGTITNGVTSAVGQVARASLIGSGGQIISGSSADADNLSTLCVIENEFAAFTSAALVSTNVYDLTLAKRGQFSTAAAPHSPGAKFIRADGQIVYSESLELSAVGKTFYFKFLSFNKYWGALQSLSDATAYSYTVTGNMVQLLSASISGITATASANAVLLNWTNTGADVGTQVQIWRSATNDVNTAALIDTIPGLVGFYADYVGGSGSTYYYWLRNINKQGYPSAFSASVSCAPGAVTPGDGTTTHAKLAADAVWAVNLKAGEVNANHMSANSVTAANGALAVAAVGTLNVAGGAVTAMQSVMGADIQLGWDNTSGQTWVSSKYRNWISLCSKTIDFTNAESTSGIHVAAIGSIFGSVVTYGSATAFDGVWKARILRDGVEVLNVDLGKRTAAGGGIVYSTWNPGLLSIAIIDQPGAGSHTYELQVRFSLRTSSLSEITWGSGNGSNLVSAGALSMDAVISQPMLMLVGGKR